MRDNRKSSCSGTDTDGSRCMTFSNSSTQQCTSAFTAFTGLDLVWPTLRTCRKPLPLTLFKTRNKFLGIPRCVHNKNPRASSLVVFLLASVVCSCGREMVQSKMAPIVYIRALRGSASGAMFDISKSTSTTIKNYCFPLFS